MPFVLSWSLLEAMSIGCAIVASDTEPVREVISHDHTGRLVNFFDAGGLADVIAALLASASARQPEPTPWPTTTFTRTACPTSSPGFSS